ncbi:hypothetical protein CFC21_107274, partial [Triticum aestivum]
SRRSSSPCPSRRSPSPSPSSSSWRRGAARASASACSTSPPPPPTPPPPPPPARASAAAGRRRKPHLEADQGVPRAAPQGRQPRPAGDPARRQQHQAIRSEGQAVPQQLNAIREEGQASRQQPAVPAKLWPSSNARQPARHGGKELQHEPQGEEAVHRQGHEQHEGRRRRIRGCQGGGRRAHAQSCDEPHRQRVHLQEAGGELQGQGRPQPLQPHVGRVPGSCNTREAAA